MNIITKETFDSHTRLTFEDAITKCITILHQEEDTIIPSLLELLGIFYSADKAHFYRIDHETSTINCEHIWRTNDSIEVSHDLTSKIDFAETLTWFESRNEMGMVDGDYNLKSCPANSAANHILQALHLDNIVLSILDVESDTGERIPVAMVGVSNRKETTMDYRLLQVISKFGELKISESVLNASIQQIQQFDVLTGFHRRSFYQQKFDELEANHPTTVGIIYGKVNGLKEINAELGLTRGDSRIKHASEVLKKHFDIDFYRISGDEFIGFYADISKEDFEKQIDQLHKYMTHFSDSSFTLGHAWSQGRYKLMDAIQNADRNMYVNKQKYYNNHRQTTDISSSTLSSLFSFLETEEFLVYLQPQFNLRDNTLHGAEALVRRFDKVNNRMIFPDQFIPLYERKLVIRHIDIFVVQQICKLLSEWKKMQKAIPISVNLSRITLLEHGIVDTISQICDSYGIPHELLVIEVTEQEGSIENDVICTLVQEFKLQGFKVSLDDFGCAYSNIVTLAQVPVDEVKIDKSLVDKLVTNKKNNVIVKNILSMCNELDNVTTLSEGIETREQANILRAFNCTLGQGYLYSRPIPIDEFYERYIS